MMDSREKLIGATMEMTDTGAFADESLIAFYSIASDAGHLCRLQPGHMVTYLLYLPRGGHDVRIQRMLVLS